LSSRETSCSHNYHLLFVIKLVD